MSEPGMPQPWLLGMPCRQAHRLLYLQVEQVQPVLGPLHLGKKSLLSVPDPKDSVLDQYLATALIQLTNVDDAGTQLRDVIYICYRAVLPVLAPEDDGAAPLDSHP